MNSFTGIRVEVSQRPSFDISLIHIRFTNNYFSIVVAPGQLAQITAHKAHLDRRLGASQSDYYHQPNMTGLEGGGHNGHNGSSMSADDKARIELRE